LIFLLATTLPHERFDRGSAPGRSLQAGAHRENS
jgi:hypothetical protein